MSGEEVARALARRLNWEPPGHSDLPGSIPDDAWDVWRRFADIAALEIAWAPVDAAAWRKAHATEWSPDFEAKSAGRHFVLVQHIWHGFPDPPEWALHAVADGKAVSLGCFDTWPETWSVAS